MKEVEKYAFFWRPEDDSGSIHLVLAGEGAADIFIDSPQEATFLLDLLRNEKPIFYNADSGQICTGLEPAGEEEKPRAKAKVKARKK